MRKITILLLLCCFAHWSYGYSAYQRPSTSSYTSGYSSSRYSSSSSSSSSSQSECCTLNSWGYSNLRYVREFANRLRLEYNALSSGSTGGYTSSATNQMWSIEIINLTGKTNSELDALVRRMSDEIIAEMRRGSLTYSTLSHPDFFQWKAATTLQALAVEGSSNLQQQQETLDLGHMPLDVTNFDEVKNVAYPAEVQIIGGKTYVVHKNCTEAHSGMPSAFTSHSYNSNNRYTSGGSYGGNVAYMPSGGSSTTTITRKKTVYDFVEPNVLGYRPVVNVDSHYTAGGAVNSYRPTIHLPVDTGSSSAYNRDVETFSTGNQVYRPSYIPSSPSSTVTIRRYNKTIITNPDGTNSVHGSELNRKWVDGKLVYDTERPFGEWSVPRDDAWKREERERLFWFLTQDRSTPQQLEQWQQTQEERLLALAQRYHTTLDDIHAWQRKELERYRVLLGQYQAQTNHQTSWKRIESGRLDWLIHQNSVTREELERWQRENQDKLQQLAQQYRISLQELKNWQIEELNRLYVYFNDQNNSMISRPIPSSGSLQISEQERLEELIRQHNATIAQLHNSIKMDQQKLSDLSQKYKGNVQDMEKWLKDELARLGGIMNEQRNQMTRITEWQQAERQRLENMLKTHQGSVGDLDAQIAHDRAYIRSLAAKYHVSIEEIEKWQRSELERLHNEGQQKLDADIKQWQLQERARLTEIIKKNDLTIEEFQKMIMSDKARLNNLAQTYKLQVTEVEDWIKNEIKNFQNQGLLKEVEKELALWQQKERARLQKIVQQNEYTIEELEAKIKGDQSQLYTLADKYKVHVNEVEQWLKQELLRLQSQGLVKHEDLELWQKQQRQEILQLVQQNRLTIEEFEKKLLQDRQRLNNLATTYNVETAEIESWIKKEGERLQNLGLLKIQEELNNWQKIERERLMQLVTQNNLSIEELQKKIERDQVHLYSLARQHNVRVEEIEAWIKKEIEKLQKEGLVEINKLKDWQTEWRGNLTNMVMERDLTVEEFHKWLLEDRARLQALAMQHNVQIEEVEQWMKNEEQRFISMGLLKPNEKLTNWQEVERRYLERITQEQYHSTEQLEQRLRQDRELLEKLARDYSIQVEEVEKWMKKELSRLRDDGQLQIDNLTAWQLAERERLEALSKQNKQWSIEEYEAVLRQDREHMQKMAFQYHTSVEEIEKWVKSEIERLRQQGKLDIEQLTAWQKKEQQRIMNLLQQQSSITVEEFERKIAQDRNFIIQLANQYHVSVVEVEEYVKKVIEDLRVQGKLEVEKLADWQRVERQYIKELISQYSNSLSTEEYEKKLLQDRLHLQQLSKQYYISVEEIEKWMIAELQRLRQNSAMHINNLEAWQKQEAQRLQNLIKQNNQITYVEYQVQLMKDREHLQQLAKQYQLNVEEIEHWLRQQLVNLKTTGQLQVESLTKWQDEEQQRLINLLLQQQKNLSYEEFEKKLAADRARLEKLSHEYSVSIEEIEKWNREQLQRLNNSGLIQIEQLNMWQRQERERLQDWLKHQNNAASLEQINEFLARDKQRLQRISQDYHVTVEEVESWVINEGARLQLIGMVQSPDYVYINNDNTEMWKTQTRAHLEAISQVKPMSWQEFEIYLKEQRPRWEQFARAYDITVEEIEYWLTESAKELVKQGRIQDNIEIQEWEHKEQLRIENLINERLRKQQQWTLEELELQLRNDRAHLQDLARQYQLTIEQIELWYKQELQRLLNHRRIITEHLNDWQLREKERIYRIVIKNPYATLEVMEQKLLSDKQALSGLADLYHISIEELEEFIRKELQRYVLLGVVRGGSSYTEANNWQQQERQRLRTIAADIRITEQELLEYIAEDKSYQHQLVSLYGCGLEQLATFQRTEIANMQQQGLFDNTKLLQVLAWQKEERERIYQLIKNQNINKKNLRDFQRQMHLLTMLAEKYQITVQELKDWQMKEFERLEQLALKYKMSLNQLQNFREKELRNLAFVMHRKTTSETERASWADSEANRMAALQRKTGLGGAELLAWRRRLYLLCQGRVPLDISEFGGWENGQGSTNRTAPPHYDISMDRGDQPPNVYEENGDGNEPGIEGHDPLYPSPNAEIRSTPAPKPSPNYLPPAPRPTAVATPVDVQRTYHYKETKYRQYSGPMGVSAQAAASANHRGSAASASIGTVPLHNDESEYQHGLEAHSLSRAERDDAEELGQQQQVELGWNEKYSNDHDDLGQQVQVEDLSDGRYSAAIQQQQQQQQVEDFGQQHQVELEDYKHSADLGQQQVQVEDLDGTFTNVHQRPYGASEKQVATEATIEVTAETEPTGFFSKIKNKIFG